MNNIRISNFKAFQDEITFSCNEKGNACNTLVYGENGAGKTSLFEAIKLCFFKDRIIHENIGASLVGEERKEQITSFFADTYNNKKANIGFHILLDDTEFDNIDPNTTKAHFITYSDIIHNVEKIQLDVILRNTYLTITDDPLDNYVIEDFIDNVNTILSKNFSLNVRVVFNRQNGMLCTLEDDLLGISINDNLTHHFNEATLHIVILILLLEAVSFNKDLSKNNLLVLDDIISSMDAANRIVIMKYIFDSFKDYQKIVFTHNVSFFNLFIYIANNFIAEEKYVWGCRDILKCGDKHVILPKRHKSATNIEQDLLQGEKQPEEVGNDIRQSFEIVIHELDKLYRLGAVEDTTSILNRVLSGNNHVYLSIRNGQVFDAYDLVDSIYSNLTNGNDFNIVKRLTEKIEEFRNNKLINDLIADLANMRLIQKVALHQTSHGHRGHAPISVKEIYSALGLLKKLEEAVANLKRFVDVSSI